MTTTTSQQNQISRLCQTMFNAAPGAVYMDNLVNYLTVNNATMTDLANTLARTSEFTGSFSYPTTLTNNEFAETFVTRVVGGTVTSATHSAAVSTIAAMLNTGQSRGEVMLWASDALSAATQNVEWATAALQFNNRVEVANYYSVDRAGGATDIGTLQAVTGNVTFRSDSLTAGKAVFDTPLAGNLSHISGATLFVDLDGDGLQDSAEPSTFTGLQGQFTFPAGSFGRIVASGGQDMTTDLPFTGTFTAPPGSTVINPLTTLVQTLIDRGIEVSLANAWVASSLGLPAGIDLTRFSALNEISGVNADAAVQVLAASVQANNLFNITASALTSVDVTLDRKTAFSQVVGALANHITSATSVLDLSNATLLREGIVASAGQNAFLIASMAPLNTDLSLLIADNNTTIDEILASGGTPETMRNQILQVARITQGPESTAVYLDSQSGIGLSDVLSTYTGSSFDILVSYAPIGDVDGDGAIDLPIPLVTPLPVVPPLPPPAPAFGTLTTANDTLIGGAGNDTFTGTYGNGSGPYTFNVGDILDGGNGIDTLSITTGAEASSPSDNLFVNKTNFEKIEFVSTGDGAQVVTTGANFLQAFATGADLTVNTLLGAITVTMTGYTQAATINTTTIGAGAHVITTGSGAAIVYATAQAAGAQTIKGIGLTTVNATIAGAGDQTIGDALGNGVNLTSVTATISGDGAQTITSTSTSTVTVIADAFNGAQAIVTGSGDDSITLTTATGQLTTITTNAGDDIIVASLGTDLITGGLGIDTMTGGGGVDTFAFGTDGSILGTSMDIITDFNAVGADILTFGTATALAGNEADGTVAGSDVDTTAGGLITFAIGDNTLALKIAAIQADIQLDAAGLVAMFIDGANTYVYYSGAATGNADDQLIQLSGIDTLLTITGGATTVIA